MPGVAKARPRGPHRSAERRPDEGALRVTIHDLTTGRTPRLVEELRTKDPLDDQDPDEIAVREDPRWTRIPQISRPYPDQPRQEGVLRGEVVVEVGPRHTGCSKDVVDGRRIEPLSSEARLGGAEDAIPRRLPKPGQWVHERRLVVCPVIGVWSGGAGVDGSQGRRGSATGSYRDRGERSEAPLQRHPGRAPIAGPTASTGKS